MAASFGMEEDLGPKREAKINNISSGGFCFLSDHKLRMGQKIQMAVDLDTVEDVIVTVKVVWINKTGNNGKYAVGVQIVEKEGLEFERFTEFYNNIK
ncbi:MAG TPA: PilZ domain-containing protein [Candidatus Omnitrophota bacterium]|nr:PilZ domain-containing protein [Candidatus Omnitrophota bacterium]